MDSRLIQTLCLFALFSAFLAACVDPRGDQLVTQSDLRPNEHFHLDRAYPEAYVKPDIYLGALAEARREALFSRDDELFDVPWTTEGPGNIGARINTVVVHPVNPEIVLCGFAHGGIWKTTNNGADWHPVFDDQISLAISDLIFDPFNPQTVYAATGDPNISSYPFVGTGVYRSNDVGESWTHLGLSETGIISKVEVHPTNPDLIFASAMGVPFERGPDRGLYKSINGGESWDQILFISDSTGVTDFLLHPTNPDIIYAAGWDRIRNNQESITFGVGARIYKSMNGGQDWSMLEGGLPNGIHSRIGLGMSWQNPDKIYALIVGQEIDCGASMFNLQGVYRTENGGMNWSQVASSFSDGLNCNVFGGFGWYFGKIRINPVDDDDIYILGVDLWRSQDGGSKWSIAAPEWGSYEVHADKHDLIFTIGDSLILATDGGLYKGHPDAPQRWRDLENIPNTQFYRIAYNPHAPDQFFGGAQDNGTTGGNAAMINQWPRIFLADGFQPRFHPTRPDTFYVEIQNGWLYATDNGGANFNFITFGIDNNRHWDMPFLMSDHNPEVLYAASQFVYMNPLGPQGAWQQISPDLTKGENLTSGRYPRITALAESPLDSLRLYAGTLDGKVWTTGNGGADWSDITTGLPDRFVTSIECSRVDSNGVFVTHSGYRDNSNTPLVHASQSAGESWEAITGGLPDLAINNIYVYPQHQDSVLFVGTDGGVYGTADGGINWERVGTNMPLVPVYDVDYNPSRNALMAGTFSRGIQSFPLDSVDLTGSTVAVRQPGQLKGLRVYPTVFTDGVVLESEERFPEARVDLFSQTGRLVFSRQLSLSAETYIDYSAVTPGAYVLRIQVGQRQSAFQLMKVN